MNWIEKACLVLLVLCVVGSAVWASEPQHHHHEFTWLAIQIAQGSMVVGVYIIVFRDLYKREFPNPNAKVTWTILLLLVLPSIPIYLWKHGFRRRHALQDGRRSGEPGALSRQ
jgi:hypothetical protein